MSDEEKGRPPLEKSVHIKAPVEQVWKAIAEGEQMARWFPLDARITPGDGEGQGRLWLSFGPGMEGEAPLHAFQENRHLGWTEDHGNGRLLSVDFYLEPAEGGTVVRLVQSGFGPEARWDDYYDAVDGGWSFFLLNLRHYVERHPGSPRRSVWRRHPVSGTRQEVWDRLFAPDGLRVPHAAQASPGDPVRLSLGDLILPGTVLMNRPPRHFATTLPGRGEGLLLIELEGTGEKWHLGVWISLYGQAREGGDEVDQALEAGLEALFPSAPPTEGADQGE